MRGQGIKEEKQSANGENEENYVHNVLWKCQNKKLCPHKSEVVGNKTQKV